MTLAPALFMLFGMSAACLFLAYMAFDSYNTPGAIFMGALGVGGVIIGFLALASAT